MALSARSVNKAREILHKVTPNAPLTRINHYSQEREFQEDVIIGVGPKDDGGFESIFLNIKDITDGQREIFDKLKSGIPNTSFVREEKKGLTCIGWF